MLISDQKKFIFLHNPKCAGTTVRQLLMPYEDRNNHYWMFENVLGYKFDKAHMSLSTFRNFNTSDFELLEKYFTFGFVRNPYSRAVSAFSETNMKLYNDFINGDKREEFLERLNNYCAKLTERNTTGFNVGFRHSIQQNKMFYFGGKCKADLIIKLEDLDSGLNKLSSLHVDIFNALKDINSKKRNQKPIKNSPENLLTKSSIDNLNRVYHDDFVLFDYDKIN
ncbi:sulfotransferase family 2 domain-containing protein [Vibrio sp. 1159]|uniref:sulfotransferase family 2 domain-containing protein n=1 Tax=Vibrio sp. 1159 TaxID=3074545 RepID=UPI002964C9EA|nr:sulfotransferase family 2 domain-containing protein [Vibrio sp. 1159]MDW2323633.1 sulfotransferase family 2 domain-containing protein [Vibrio sp. 1159]